MKKNVGILSALQYCLVTDRSVGCKGRYFATTNQLQIYIANLVGMHHQHTAHDANDPDVLLTLIAEQRVGYRPGRIEPRNLKRRPKAFPFLMEPREEARTLVKKNRHPKKFK